ncbi:hypothetical protein KUF71_009355 [Frankliniella fusca]|uniref:Uncharacterized protein n=1 Tax=Frankliniella fusca TaxID=407009 RepID=A0AAE1HF63_9NEOP|nr:hypothetical protein KUF71_009355 [Frankliniella fusca]
MLFVVLFSLDCAIFFLLIALFMYSTDALCGLIITNNVLQGSFLTELRLIQVTVKVFEYLVLQFTIFGRQLQSPGRP